MNSRTLCLVANIALTLILWVAALVGMLVFSPLHWALNTGLGVLTLLPIAYVEQHFLSGIVNSIFYKEGD